MQPSSNNAIVCMRFYPFRFKCQKNLLVNSLFHISLQMYAVSEVWWRLICHPKNTISTSINTKWHTKDADDICKYIHIRIFSASILERLGNSCSKRRYVFANHIFVRCVQQSCISHTVSESGGNLLWSTLSTHIWIRETCAWDMFGFGIADFGSVFTCLCNALCLNSPKRVNP